MLIWEETTQVQKSNLSSSDEKVVIEAIDEVYQKNPSNPDYRSLLQKLNRALGSKWNYLLTDTSRVLFPFDKEQDKYIHYTPKDESKKILVWNVQDRYEALNSNLQNDQLKLMIQELSLSCAANPSDPNYSVVLGSLDQEFGPKWDFKFSDKEEADYSMYSSFAFFKPLAGTKDHRKIFIWKHDNVTPFTITTIRSNMTDRDIQRVYDIFGGPSSNRMNSLANLENELGSVWDYDFIDSIDEVKEELRMRYLICQMNDGRNMLLQELASGSKPEEFKMVRTSLEENQTRFIGNRLRCVRSNFCLLLKRVERGLGVGWSLLILKDDLPTDQELKNLYGQYYIFKLGDDARYARYKGMLCKPPVLRTNASSSEVQIIHERLVQTYNANPASPNYSMFLSRLDHDFGDKWCMKFVESLREEISIIGQAQKFLLCSPLCEDGRKALIWREKSSGSRRSCCAFCCF
ncbi:hypothetical protein Ciccas_013813 [Cichlidogyrus casuarinus]|uniref:Uncharacterized protein n=1 Tax=Cichlidogyrus casuarinus TaxID=1844966 RepID=A0ABD2PL34_9PLAT